GARGSVEGRSGRQRAAPPGKRAGGNHFGDDVPVPQVPRGHQGPAHGGAAREAGRDAGRAVQGVAAPARAAGRGTGSLAAAVGRGVTPPYLILEGPLPPRKAGFAALTTALRQGRRGSPRGGRAPSTCPLLAGAIARSLWTPRDPRCP